jgi:hypothetical protein
MGKSSFLQDFGSAACVSSSSGGIAACVPASWDVGAAAAPTDCTLKSAAFSFCNEFVETESSLPSLINGKIRFRSDVCPE